MGKVDVHEPARADDPDGVDEIVDAFEAVHGGGNGVPHSGLVGAVRLDRQGLSIARIGRRRDVDRGHSRTGLTKQLDDGAANAAGRTCHQRGASGRRK